MIYYIGITYIKIIFAIFLYINICLKFTFSKISAFAFYIGLHCLQCNIIPKTEVY